MSTCVWWILGSLAVLLVLALLGWKFYLRVMAAAYAVSFTVAGPGCPPPTKKGRPPC